MLAELEQFPSFTGTVRCNLCDLGWNLLVVGRIVCEILVLYVFVLGENRDSIHTYTAIVLTV